MLKLAKNVLTLSDFKRRSAELIRRMRRTRQPIVLTVKGKAEVVVQDTASYQEMLERVERAETIEGIQRGLADIETGKSRSLDDFDRHMRRKYRIPSGEE